VSFNSPSDGPSGTASVAPLVRDDRAILDLRSKPTRESLGFRPGSTGAAYDRERGSAGITVHVELPTGASTDLLAYGLASEAMPMRSVPGSDLRNPAPTATIVNVRYPSPEAAQEALLRQADALGLERDRIGVTAGGARPGVLATGVIYGLRQDWLDIEVEIRTDQDAGEVLANYEFNYNAEMLAPRQ
jgi:hypothetical protein